MKRILKMLRGNRSSRRRPQGLGTPMFERLEPRLLLNAVPYMQDFSLGKPTWSQGWEYYSIPVWGPEPDYEKVEYILNKIVTDVSRSWKGVRVLSVQNCLDNEEPAIEGQYRLFVVNAALAPTVDINVIRSYLLSLTR